MAIKSKDTKPIKFYILSFFIPLFFAVIALAFAGIYPFGTKSIAGSDLGSQFLPVTVLKADMLKNGIKSFFTYKCGFGANAVSLFFGNTSILDSLFLFFDKLYYQDVFFAVYIIKIGLGGLCAYIYFDRSRIICCDALTALALSVLYAVCTHFILYSVMVVLLENPVLLPICLLGIENIIGQKKGFVFCAAFFLCVINSFYYAYMTGVTCFIYFIYFCVITKKQASKKEILTGFLLMCFYAALTAALCAVVIIPEMKAVVTGYDGLFEDSPFSPLFCYSIGEVCAGLMFIKNSTLVNLGLDIYFGIIPLFIITLYISSNKINKAERIITAVLCLVFMLVLSLKPLYLILHMCRLPKCLDARFMYGVVFMCLVFCARAVPQISNFGKKYLYIPVLLCIIGCALALTDKITIRYAVNSVLVIIAASVYAVCFYKFSDKKYFGKILFLFIISEALYNSVGGIAVLSRFGTYPEHSEYAERLESSKKDAEVLSQTDGGFYRSCDVDQTAPMTQLLGGYNSYSAFSSGINQLAFETARLLGAMVPQGNYITHLNSGIMTDTLFGVKYITGKNDMPVPENKKGYEKIYDDGDMYVLENKYALPILFSADRAAADCAMYFGDPDTAINAVFNNQQIFLSSILNKNIELFTEYEYDEAYISGCTLETAQDGMTENMVLTDIPDGSEYALNDSMAGRVKYVFTVPKDGEYCIDTFFDTNIEDIDHNAFSFTVNGKAPERIMQSEKNAHDIGYFKKGEKIEFEITSLRSPFRFLKPTVMRLDTDVLGSVTKQIKALGLTDIKEKDGIISAAADLAEDGFVLTTIGYDEGIKVTADGKECKKIKAAGAFLAFDLPKGKHSITISYTPPGAKMGAAVSAAAVIMIIILMIKKRTEVKK